MDTTIFLEAREIWNWHTMKSLTKESRKLSYCFSEEKAETGTVIFDYIPTTEMAADMMTKPLLPTKH